MPVADTLTSIETAAIDLRLSHLRQRDGATEKILLESIRIQGVKEPLLVVMHRPQHYLLLDGFKRYRCARLLSIGAIPALSLQGQEKEGLLCLLRYSREKGLTELEHGALIDRLHTAHGMSVRQIALELGCSIGWVSMRLGIVEHMSPLVRQKVLGGHFPPRAYLYGVRAFTRVNGIDGDIIDRFVTSVSGRDLSTRDLFILTRAYFTGGRCIKERIEQGDVTQVLEALKSGAAVDATVAFGAALEDMATMACCMERLIAALPALALDGEIAPLRAHLVAANLLRRIGPFTRTMRSLYGRTTETLGGNGAVATGQKQETHRSSFDAGRQDGTVDHCGRGQAEATGIAGADVAAH